MASPSMVSNVSALRPSPSPSPPPGSPEGSGDQQPHHRAAMEERKRKRKESNRLSAQRSRARKQRQLDDLTAQVAALRARNGATATAARAVAHRCAAVQAENELLRARTIELSARLHSLTDLLQCMEAAGAYTTAASNPFVTGAGAYTAAMPPPPPPLLDATMYCDYY